MTTLAPSLPAPAEQLPVGARIVRAYLDGLAPRSQRTMMGCLTTVAKMIAGEGAGPLSLPWDHLRFEHVQRLVAELRDRYNSPATANLHLAALKGLARAAWRLGLLDADAFARIADVKGVKGRRLPAGRAVTEGELRALLEAVGRDGTSIARRDGALLALIFGAGLRRSEVVRLELADLELDSQEGAAVRVLGKGNRQDRQPLPAGTVRYIRDWIAVRGALPGPLLTVVLRGGHVRLRGLNDQAVADVLTRRAGRAGVERIRPHDARRTFVSAVLDATGDLNAARMLARHESVSTTQVYDRRGERVKRTAADTIVIPYTRGVAPTQAQVGKAEGR